jgi:alpha-tubulin suppressor-like RCC1 family protein
MRSSQFKSPLFTKLIAIFSITFLLTGIIPNLSNGPTAQAAALSNGAAILQIDAGGNNTCAVMANHTVQCVGQNDFGQLGTGTSGGNSPTPVQVFGIYDAVQVSVGQWHACALLQGGTVKCWGHNGVG